MWDHARHPIPPYRPAEYEPPEAHAYYAQQLEEYKVRRKLADELRAQDEKEYWAGVVIHVSRLVIVFIIFFFIAKLIQ